MIAERKKTLLRSYDLSLSLSLSLYVDIHVTAEGLSESSVIFQFFLRCKQTPLTEERNLNADIL